MALPVIIGPVVLPEMPEPSVSDCKTLLTYTNSLINSLEMVQSWLNEVSTVPDEALLTIQGRVSNMLSEAKEIRSKLIAIKAEATKKANLANQGTVTF